LAQDEKSPSGPADSPAGERIVGAAPAGARDEASAAAAVRDMFTSIAPRYDLLNHVLSMNIDRVWWNRTASVFSEVLHRPEARLLDLCCGTGDMTFALHRRLTAPTSAKSPQQTQKRRLPGPPTKAALVGGPLNGEPTQILGVDFSHAMLVRAEQKSAGRNIGWVEADALNLPFPADQFQLVTSAFGFRNLANYDRGLAEIYRVLAPQGEVGILDFGEPKGLIGKLYRVYFRRVLPAIGTLISGVRGPYAYLPASVLRFPSPHEMLQRMRGAGFREVTWTPYTFGIAGLYRGKK
jgi:demethylmenaquinone methyltransferase/2-methoxy-6-polyprenyl-1,4-benzoquinol methylase